MRPIWGVLVHTRPKNHIFNTVEFFRRFEAPRGQNSRPFPVSQKLFMVIEIKKFELQIKTLKVDIFRILNF